MFRCLTIIVIVSLYFATVLGRTTTNNNRPNLPINLLINHHYKEQIHKPNHTQYQQQQQQQQQQQLPLSSSTTNNELVNNNYWNDITLLYKIYTQCNQENLTVCLKIKLLTALEKATQIDHELQLVDGIKFVNDQNENNEILQKKTYKNLLTENDIKNLLPRSLNDQETSLNYMLFEKLLEFVRSHTLQVKFPDMNDFKRSSSTADDEQEDGRRRRQKKGGAYIMIPLLLGGTFIPLAYGALALLAGKALIVSKLALVLASIIGIKKLLSGNGHKDQHEVVVSSGHSSGWGRELAYQAYNPEKKSSDNVLQNT